MDLETRRHDAAQQILLTAEIEMTGFQCSDFNNNNDDEKEIWEDLNEGDSKDRNIFNTIFWRFNL